MSKTKTLLRVARALARESGSKLGKVGALVVDRDQRIVVSGNNSTVAYAGGLYTDEPYEDEHEGKLVSKPSVTHAEEACIAHAARKGIALEGCTMFVTTAPCYQCARLILQAGITAVYYENEWWDRAVLEFLVERGVAMHHINSDKI